MVEMAFVLPLFLVLVFGIIEFSFAFAQNNELRNLAREGARIATVQSISSQDITDQLCSGISLIDSSSFGFKVDGVDGNGTDPTGSKGAIGEAYAEVQLRTLTGFFDAALTGIDFRSTVRFFVERPLEAAPAWWSTTATPLSCS